jgi:phosphate starvation-inducible protein PhoH
MIILPKIKASPIAQLQNSKERDRFYKKLDEYQLAYYNAIMEKSVICCNQPAGTGKTQIAVMAGLELLAQGKISKLIYLRFPDDRSLKLGFLPGDLELKQIYYMYPFYEAASECGLQDEVIDSLIEEKLIELTTDISMRGRNLKSSFIICDETQNARMPDLKLVLTRLHDDSKCVMIGHNGQVDNYKGNDNAFIKYIEHMCKKPWAINCDLPNNYRGKISKWADELY